MLTRKKWRQYAARKALAGQLGVPQGGRAPAGIRKRQLANDFDAGVFVTADEAALFKRMAPGATGTHLLDQQRG